MKFHAASPNLTETNLLSEANILLFSVKKSGVYWSFQGFYSKKSQVAILKFPEKQIYWQVIFYLKILV